MVPASPELASQLAVPPGQNVVRLYRLRRADGQPMALERSHLLGRFAWILEEDMEHGSMHAALRARGVQPTLARGTLVAEACDGQDARLLGIRKGAPLLVERRTVFDQNGTPIEATETRYVGERYVLDIELHREGETADGNIH